MEYANKYSGYWHDTRDLFEKSPEIAEEMRKYMVRELATRQLWAAPCSGEEPRSCQPQLPYRGLSICAVCAFSAPSQTGKLQRELELAQAAEREGAARSRCAQRRVDPGPQGVSCPSSSYTNAACRAASRRLHVSCRPSCRLQRAVSSKADQSKVERKAGTGFEPVPRPVKDVQSYLALLQIHNAPWQVYQAMLDRIATEVRAGRHSAGTRGAHRDTAGRDTQQTLLAALWAH